MPLEFANSLTGTDIMDVDYRMLIFQDFVFYREGQCLPHNCKSYIACLCFISYLKCLKQTEIYYKPKKENKYYITM